MRRIKLYYLFVFSTLKINVPFSVLASLLIVKWDWSIFFEPFPYMLGGLGIVASLLYKEILEKEAYYFIKNFGTRQLLSDVYLRINTGDVIGLFGRNGTGKSVLMQIIFGTMKADRKFIRLDGCKILPAPYRHSGTIAFLPQQGYLPKHQKMKQLVRYYLDTDVVSDFYKDDEVAQSCMDRRVSQLSGGERRYLEAKLLLLGDTKFVLLDEPFDYLSFHLADKLIELIKKHSVNKGIVISDHNYGKVLEVVNRLTLIREGVLLELTDKRGLVEQGYLLSESYL